MAHRPAAADRDRGACRNRRGGWICRGDMGRAHPAGMVRPSVERPPMELTSDWRLAVFTLSVAFLVYLIAGLIPALRATNPGRLATSRQVGGGRHRRLLDRCLVAAQVGLSLVLLVAAGLFVRTLQTCGRGSGILARERLMFSVDARLAGRRPGPAGDLPGRPRLAADAARRAEPPRCRRSGR